MNFAQCLRLILIGLICFGGPALLAADESKDQKQPTQTEKPAETKSAKININTAELDQLTTLPRIGPAIAQRILDFRAQHGSFESLEELMNVKGIGEKTFERLEGLITL